MRKQILMAIMFMQLIFYISGNELINIAHYQQDPAQNILLAMITFDFEKPQTVIEVSHETNNGFCTYEFLFPHAHISNARIKSKIDVLHKAYIDTGFNIGIDTVEIPTPGIRVTVRCDPQKVELVYSEYDAIMQRGIIDGFDTGIAFALYNKPLIRQLDGKKHEPTIRTAYNERKNYY